MDKGEEVKKGHLSLLTHLLLRSGGGDSLQENVCSNNPREERKSLDEI